MRRLDCHNHIKQVRTSHQTAVQSVTVFIGIVEAQPELLRDHHFDLSEIRAILGELDEIYFVRIFACFESSIRQYWWAKIRQTKPITEQLLNSIAGRFGVPQDTLDAVHEVRDFRNSLIHQDYLITKRFTVDEASGILNTYLARLPLEW